MRSRRRETAAEHSPTANAHRVDDDESDESSGEDDDESEGDETDRRMTDRFRDPADASCLL